MLCRVAPIEGDAYLRGGRNSGQLCQGWIENSYLLYFLQVMRFFFKNKKGRNASIDLLYRNDYIVK